MKKVLCLCIVLLLLLPGCAVKDEVTFYYSRIEFQYDVSDGVIAAERRDVTGHLGDLEFLLSLYLMGPLETELTSPFPSGTKLLSLEHTGETLTVTLSDMDPALSDSAYSLACACIALTCMDLTQASSVTIISGEKVTTITPELLTLYDSGVPAESVNGGT